MGTVGTSIPAAQRTVEAALRGRKADVRGQVFKVSALLALLVSLAFLLILLWTILAEALPVLRDRGLDFVTSSTSSLPSRAGVWQGLIGSLILIGFVLLMAVPIGIAAAIYLQEYARDTWLNRTLTTTIRNLGGVPSIVYGILGLVVFVKIMRPVTGPDSSGRSYISGGLTLAVLVMPIVILVTMEALRSVPASLREGAYGVGATRWEVVRSHVLPYAAPGVFTGVILSMARAFGETAPLILVGAVQGYLNQAPGSVVETLQGPYTALPTLVFAWSRYPGDEWRANAAAAIVVLLAVILLVNLFAIILRNRYERRW